MNIKRKELVRFYRTLLPVSNREGTFKFHYALHKNLQKIHDMQKYIDEEARVPEYINYLHDLDIIKKKYASIDSVTGEPIVENTDNAGFPVYKMDYADKEKMKKIKKEIKDLEEKYNDSINEMQEKMKIHSEKLEEEIDFNFHKVDIDFFPNINGNEADLLQYMVKEVDKSN